MPESNPTAQNDVVIIHGTVGTPANYYAAHPMTETATYDGNGRMTQYDYTMNGVLRARETFSYTGDELTSINTKIYGLDGTTVEQEWTETISYDAGKIDGIGRVIPE